MSDIRFNQWLHQSGTGGVSQVASGAVGVGTTNPLADFYVRGDAQITGILTAGHIAMGSSITFGDGDRAYFGDGTDMQLYHNGTNSYIENGTNALNIKSYQIFLQNANGSEDYLKATDGYGVELYHNNNKRIETTGYGVTVFGAIKSTNLSIAGVTTFSDTTESSSPTTGSVRLLGGLGVVKNIQTSGGLYATGTAGLNITHSADINGDLDVDGHTNLDNVSIAGVTTFAAAPVLPSLSGTNSNASLPVLFRTSSGAIDGGSGLTYNPAQDVLSVNGNHISRQVFRGDGALGMFTCDNHSSTTFVNVSNTVDISTVDNAANAFTLKQGSNEYITVDTTNSSELITLGNNTTHPKIVLDGHVGIHTTTPYSPLEIQGDAGVSDARITFTRHGSPSNGTVIGQNFYRIGTDSVAAIGAYRESAMDDAYLAFHTQPTGGSFAERLRILSNGRVHIRPSNTFYAMNSQSTDLVIGDGGGGRGITFWTAGAADNQTISFQCNETLSRAEGEISYGPTATSTATDRNAMMFRTNSAERLRITSTGRFGFNRSAPHYAMHLSPAAGESRIDLHMTNSTTGHNATDGVQFGYQNSAGAYIWNFENTPIYFGQNNIKKFEIHATGSTQIYKGDLLLGPDSVSQMEATIRAWGCSLWYTTIDPNYYHDSGGEFRQFYNKGSAAGDNYLTCYNCSIQGSIGPQNRVFWRGAAADTRAEGNVDVSVGYRGAWFFIGQTSCSSIPFQGSGRYLYDSNSPSRVSVSFDSFSNNIDSGELSFHCGSTAGYNSQNSSVGGRLGSSSSDSTLRMYCVGVNMENYNAPNSKRAGNHLGISVMNNDGTDYGSSRLSENLINNGGTGNTNSGSTSGTEFNWGNRHSNDRGATTTFRHSQLMYFDDVQLNSAQWDYLEHYFKVMYG